MLKWHQYHRYGSKIASSELCTVKLIQLCQIHPIDHLDNIQIRLQLQNYALHHWKVIPQLDLKPFESKVL